MRPPLKNSSASAASAAASSAVVLAALFGGLGAHFAWHTRTRLEPPAEDTKATSDSAADGTLHRMPQAQTMWPASTTAVHTARNADARVATNTDADTPFQAPRLETYRNEARLFPHSTPPSLIAFAASFEKRFSASASSSNPSERDAFFAEAATCVRGENPALPFAVRSFCLLRLKAFVERVPSHTRDFENLLATLPDAGVLAAPHRGLQ